LQLLYIFYFSQTAHIPGPWWARVSKIPLLVATFKGYRASFAHKLIEQYGPVVVIAPNQVHTSNEEAIKVIYNRKSIKTDFYANMGSWKGVKSTLGILDYDSASTTRTNLIQCFQNRNLDTLNEHIDSHIVDFVAAIRSHIKDGKATECLFWYRLLALDIVTDVLWGEQTELVTSATAGEINNLFLRRFHAFSKYNALRSFLPGLDLFVRTIGPKSWKQLRNDLSDLDLTARAALDRWEASGRNKGHEKDVLSMLCSLNNHSNPSKRLPMSHIPAYLVEMLAAGSSTTSTTAALFCYEVASNAEFQSKLRKEVFDAFPDPGNIDMKTAQKLPLLHAALQETMRVYPVIPGPLERYIGDSVSVDGKSLYPGTIASGSAYTQARLSEVFPDSEEWLPSRWLEADEESLERMNQNWLPFGQGSRACPGSNLALNETSKQVQSIQMVKARREKEFHCSTTSRQLQNSVIFGYSSVKPTRKSDV
jgi:cytochrome P450